MEVIIPNHGLPAAPSYVLSYQSGECTYPYTTARGPYERAHDLLLLQKANLIYFSFFYRTKITTLLILVFHEKLK